MKDARLFLRVRARAAPAGWRISVAAAAAAGAILGMLPGAFLMSVLRDPLPTLAVGPVLFLNGAVLSGLAAGWIANMDPQREGRSLFGPIMVVALASGAIVASLWVVLIASGWWALAFPFDPYHGVLGLGLFIGAATALATGLFRDEHEPDLLDGAISVILSGIPPVAIVTLLQLAEKAGMAI